MGFFKRNKKQQDALDQAEQTLNKGLSGLFVKSIIPKEQREQMNAGLQSARNAQTAAQGHIPVTAMGTVLTIQDTGKLVNFDPIVVMTLDILENSGARYQKTMETLVPKMHIPRPGDRIGLGTHPSRPSEWIYMGPLN